MKQYDAGKDDDERKIIAAELMVRGHSVIQMVAKDFIQRHTEGAK